MRLKLFTALSALLLFAAPVLADLTIGPGGSATYIREDKTSEPAGDLFAEMEYSTALDLDAKHWLGVMAAYDGEEFAGLGLRYYLETAGGAVYPGVGISAYTLGTDHLSRESVLVGGELLLELRVAAGGGTLPLKAFAGIYPAIDGADATMYRFGLMVTPELLQE